MGWTGWLEEARVHLSCPLHQWGYRVSSLLFETGFYFILFYFCVALTLLELAASGSHRYFCHCLLSTGIEDMCHQTWLLLLLLPSLPPSISPSSFN